MPNKIILTPEQEQWFIDNYPNTKNADICLHLGISLVVLHRFARKFGLTKTSEFCRQMAKQASEKAWVTNRINNWPPKGYHIPKSEQYGFQKGVTNVMRLGPEREKARIEKSVASRRKTVELERARFRWGFPQKTKLKIGHNRKRTLYRHKLKKRGYRVERGAREAYVVEDTKRSLLVEKRAAKYGIRIIENLGDKAV